MRYCHPVDSESGGRTGPLMLFLDINKYVGRGMIVIQMTLELAVCAGFILLIVCIVD